MEEFRITGVWGTEVVIQTDEEGTIILVVDRTGAEITKENARILGEWLIKQSE